MFSDHDQVAVSNLRHIIERNAAKKLAIRSRLADFTLLHDERALLVRELRDANEVYAAAWDELRYRRARLEAAA